MATPAPGRPSVFGMQHYPMHAEGTSFVQPNEARHIQTSVSGIRQKTRRTFSARDEHLAGVADTGARCALTANGGRSRGGGRIFTIMLRPMDFYRHRRCKEETKEKTFRPEKESSAFFLTSDS